MKNYFHQQVELLLRVLPYIAKENCFALKGGTAINFFVHDMPRLSVDIDLTYLPIESRDSSLKNIDQALNRIRQDLTIHFPGIKIREKRTQENNNLNKLFIDQNNVLIKVEPNTILRGSVFPCELQDLCNKAEETFQMAVSNMPILSVPDLYGGKICAALDRQHPRDLFDVKLLFENDGITDQIRQAIVIYLLSGNRPVYELLNPNPKLKNLRIIYENEFSGMSEQTFTYDELHKTRLELVNHLLESFTDNERKFMLSVEYGQPDWKLMPIEEIGTLPALQWKVMNIQKMDKKKHENALNNLKKVLSI